MNILTLNDIAYAYEGSKKKVFEHLSCEFEEGKIYAVVGRSGAGKTTLLSILSGLTNPTEGTVYYRDKDVSKLDRYEYRSKYVGIIFQSFNLLAHLTAQENVMLSMDVSGVHYTDKKEKAMELLHKVGLSEDEAKRRILKLSGGQQQRVAIARALSYEPEIILADEPTGNLDQETENEIMDIFQQLAQEGKCIIIVTHSKEVTEQADVIREL